METFSNLSDQKRPQSAGVRALRHRRSSYIRGHLPGVPDECETKNESPKRNSVLPVEPTPTPKPDLEMIVVKGLVVRECENLTHEEHRLVSRVPRGDLKILQEEQDPYIQFEILRAIPGGLPAKKVIRTKLAVNPVKVLSGFQAWKYKRRLGFRKFMLSLSELRDRLEIWGYWFKKIEGEFGNGVLSYFKFLKWLWKLNIYIFLLVTLFIVIPQGVFKEDPDYSEVAGNISDARINETLHCSALYKVDTDNGFVQVILDFIQGTGWMEKTPMFYGEYSDRQLSIGETSYKYNMPLAYFCLTLVYFTLSLVLMCRQTRATLREQIVQNQYTTRILGYANIVFGGWDFTLSAEKSALMRQKALFYEIRSILEDSRHRARRETRSVFTKCKLYLIRVIINLIVFSMLGGAGYLIYFATMKSTELKNIEDYEQLNRFVQLLYEFIPSLTITGLNAIIPLFFTKIVKGEDYSPDFEIRMTLGRTVFLRLASVAVLLATLYYQITCTPVDECNVGTGECTQLRCWETFFGQQIYRLIIVSFAAKIGIILCVEFPRRIIVSVFKFKLTEMVGRQEFDIPKQVLDIVYNQTLCWLATFFAPLTPVIFVIGCPLIFYLMVATTLINYVPAKKPYRSSKAHIFFMMVLITAFILCCVPIGYCIWQVRPSIGCGPFRLYDDIYDILTITIDTSWPQILQDIVHFFTSAGFLVALFVILILIIYYYQSAASGRSEMIELLREQITIESRDKQFLLGRLTELGGAGQNKKNDKEKKQESKSDSKSNGQTSYNSMEETEPLSKHF